MKCGHPYCNCIGDCFAQQSPLDDHLHLPTMTTNSINTNEQNELAELIRKLRDQRYFNREGICAQAADMLETYAQRPAMRPLTEGHKTLMFQQASAPCLFKPKEHP